MGLVWLSHLHFSVFKLTNTSHIHTLNIQFPKDALCCFNQMQWFSDQPVLLNLMGRGKAAHKIRRTFLTGYIVYFLLLGICLTYSSSIAGIQFIGLLTGWMILQRFLGLVFVSSGSWTGSCFLAGRHSNWISSASSTCDSVGLHWWDWLLGNLKKKEEFLSNSAPVLVMKMHFKSNCSFYFYFFLLPYIFFGIIYRHQVQPNEVARQCIQISGKLLFKINHIEKINGTA